MAGSDTLNLTKTTHKAHRKTGCTNYNAVSSRSHTILTLVLARSPLLNPKYLQELFLLANPNLNGF